MGTLWTDPDVSAHDTKEEAEAYDAWFREEVRLGFEEANRGELTPHDQVVADMRALQERNAGRAMFVSWTPRARSRLQFYYEQIWEESPAGADFVMNSILTAAALIPDHPYIYGEGRLPKTREMVTLPNYIVVYRIRAKQIDILNVIHTRKRYPLNH